MATRQAHYEMAAILTERSMAAQTGASLHPTMEESFYRAASLRASVAELSSAISLLTEYPELAAHLKFEGEEES